jgi:hypothetical protein
MLLSAVNFETSALFLLAGRRKNEDHIGRNAGPALEV